MKAKAKPTRSSAGVVIVLISAVLTLTLIGWQLAETTNMPTDGEESRMTTPSNSDIATKEAIFAGGCFWCIEAAYELMPGVVEAIAGYTGGHVENPTYEQVISGTTGHFESVLVRYDPTLTSYEELLDLFWRNVNPTDEGGQFYDRGSQYYTAIFYLDDEQRAMAEASKIAVEGSGVFDRPIVTQILPAQTFYVAEDYHQDYAEKYLAQYKAYTKASGRDAYLEETWEEQQDASLVPSSD